MNKFAWLSASAMLALAMMGCATTPSNLPMVDVSKMPDKALTAAEIDSVVRGKQMVGNVTLANGYSVPRVIYVFEADGTLHGANPSDWDKGKWRVDQAKSELCNAWSRWLSGCIKASVRNGKLHLFNPATGGQYLQQ
ncbi:MAG: hypothetical protein U1E71_13975 [Ramlibacter sp.]|mgnify:CR=1 FL=1|jgi:hypothetical protein